MKILHTSDWHICHSLYNFDRSFEQEDMLRQIVEIVRSEQPDVFLLSGDVYHTAQPSAAAQHLFADIMTDLHLAAPTMRIFVTAGNHDSPSRHDIFSRPWRALNVTTIGSVDADNIEDLIYEIPDIGFVIAVPFVHWRNMPENLYRRLSDICSKRNSENLPVVMMAHTAVAGVNYSGHDHSDERTVGGIDCISPEEFGKEFDYLALGHIHKPQTLNRSRPVMRYSGTPLAVSFDEDYEHSVSIVEISRDTEEIVIREVPIENPRPLVTLPRESATTFDNILALLSDFPDDIPAYLRLNIEIEDFLPHNARERVLEAIRDKKCRFCTFNVTRKGSKDSGSERESLTVNEFRELSPIEVACRYAKESEMELTYEQIEMLTDLFNENT